MLCIVLNDERTSAPNKEKTHHFSPIVRLKALLEGGEAGKRRVGILQAELRLADFLQHIFGTNSDVFLLVNEQTKLIGKIEVSFVVGGRGEKNDFGVVVLNIVSDRLINFTFAVSKIV